jgi:hypothetical protein
MSPPQETKQPHDRRSEKERRSGVKRTAIILAVVALGIYAVSLYQSFSGAGS